MTLSLPRPVTAPADPRRGSSWGRAFEAAVCREAEALDFVEEAYVAPNGREFLFQGRLSLGKGQKPTMTVLAKIQGELAPKLEPFVDAWYYPSGTPVREGWRRVYKRAESSR